MKIDYLEVQHGGNTMFIIFPSDRTDGALVRLDSANIPVGVTELPYGWIAIFPGESRVDDIRAAFDAD